MNMRMLALVAGLVLAVGLGSRAGAQQQFVSIGTGGLTGVYYPAGGAVCRMVNRGRKQHGIRCSAESTDGSIHNVGAIRERELEFGVVQSDWQYHAVHGTGRFGDSGPFEGLRAVFSIHPEPVTIIARAGAGIGNVTDLKGKRVNIGNPGSGMLGTWEILEAALGWTRGDLALATEMKAADAAQALCANQIDAYFSLVGHLATLTQDALASCDAGLVNATGAAVDRLVAENSYYRRATIPAGMYGENPEISTFGVGATLVTSADVPAEVVYVVVKSVFDNFEDFRELHPALADLDPGEMIRDFLSAPLHEGAVRYYRERGWM